LAGSPEVAHDIAVAWGLLTYSPGSPTGLLAASAGGVLWVACRPCVFLLGAANAPIFPSSPGTFANWFPVASWALPNAITNVGISLARRRFGAAVTLLIIHSGWRESFYLLAPFGFAAAAGGGGTRGIRRKNIARLGGGAHTHPGGPPAAGSTPVHTRFAVSVKPRRVAAGRELFSAELRLYIFAQWLFAYLVDEKGFSL